ncbi:MAG: DNA polymerase III subunit gamma/tau [Betaproteobacteria bacterium]|nr:DNA polymerase III subunit gamma/tau [Betaproteobacteria bacterium]
MTYQVLARKWRPRTFESLVGQEHVVRALTHALDHNRLHHAYLFTGTRGVGKTTLARILAKALNCETGISATPCGQCSACVEIDSGRFVDLIEVDAATNTKVDEMRQLLENAVYSPTRGRFKVYVIDEVHMLSTSAFNSMLKTLEEPPEHIKFVLATTDPQKIPVTVLSRCLQFNLKQVPASAITLHLKRVAQEESIPVEGEALSLIAASARGSMRDALSLLDQATAYSGGNVSRAAVRAMLGTVDDGYLYAILDAIAAGDARAALAVADDMEARNLSFDGALQELASLLHRVALAQTAPEALAEDLPHRDRLLALAQRLDAEEVQLHYQIAVHGRQDLPLAPDDYAGFTMSLLRMIAFRPEERGRAPEPAAKAASGTRTAGPAPTMPKQAVAFDGDWPNLARQLSVSGLAKQLAQQSELKSFDGEVMTLSIAPTAKHLTEKPYKDKLQAALAERLGKAVRLSVQIGSVRGDTAQERAASAIGKDAFVRDLIEHFDATIVTSSIKPVQ